MKIEYETINDGIFKGYTVAFERKYVAVFDKDSEFKRSTLAKNHSATNFVESDKEKLLLNAYCFDLARQLVSFCLKEITKEQNLKDERLFNYKVGYEVSTIPENLAKDEEKMNFLIEAFDFCAVSNLKSVPPEREQEYCRLSKVCHNELSRIMKTNSKPEFQSVLEK
ncbi:MAG: hypothetical protein J6J24_01500 [Clostridia bacterium]|nr:hypothetical protein [Clostridia bacterium]